MPAQSRAIDCPPELLEWVQECSGGKVLSAARPSAGASREAWTVTVESTATPSQLFLLRDKGSGQGSERDARVLRALHHTEVPVPKVIAHSQELCAILLEKVPGSSNFTGLAEGLAKEQLIGELMQLLAKLHALEPATLGLEHLEMPRNITECTKRHIGQLQAALPALGEQPEPFFVFAVGWLARKQPVSNSPIVLVHSDIGPDNFLFEGDRVSAILDWEVAHFGDPMEDLAALAVRDMATPVGDLSRRFGEYELAAGRPVDRRLVAYYRVLLLVRNSLMITIGLKYPPAGFDSAEMQRYQALLMRAAALCLRDYADGAVTGIAELPPESLAVFPEDDLALLAAVNGVDAAGGHCDGWLIPGFVERTSRLAEDRREAMGELFERYPQPLDGRLQNR